MTELKNLIELFFESYGDACRRMNVDRIKSVEQMEFAGIERDQEFFDAPYVDDPWEEVYHDCYDGTIPKSLYDSIWVWTKQNLEEARAFIGDFSDF